MERPIPLRKLEKEGIIRGPPVRRLEDIDTAQAIPCCAIRNNNENFPLWRRIVFYEEMTLKDILFSPITLDAITVFGIRLPEL
jgi:hypothetical protein